MLYSLYFKRVIDFIVAVSLFFTFLPIIIIVGILLYFFLDKEVFFSQIRPGKDEKVFKIWKFKTMSDMRDSNGNLLPDNLRITKFGKAIRKLSIDELPQLYNVIKGDMSLVGPRPLLIEYLYLYNDKQKIRHKVKPGITGWAQVNGRNAISWNQKFGYDAWYVENMSFMLDLKILFLTIKKVFISEGINQGEHVTMEKFLGNN